MLTLVVHPIPNPLPKPIPNPLLYPVSHPIPNLSLNPIPNPASLLYILLPIPITYTKPQVALEDSKKKAILDKYGSQAQPALDPRLRLGQSEAFVEYSRDGRVLKGVDKAPTRTKYEEDVYVNNHMSVWGSYYSRLRRQWGYCCCHSLMRNSYCTGEKGREANDAANGTFSINTSYQSTQSAPPINPLNINTSY